MKIIDIIPTPKGIKTKNQRIEFPATINNTDVNVSAFISMCEKKDIEFSISENGTISFQHSNLLHENEYRLEVGDKIIIYYSNKYSIQYALASLYQITMRSESGILVPICTITDEPDFDYRGLMIDCARSHHSISELCNYIDLCWQYKLKYLQLHLSDDCAFRLPMKKYSKLTSDISYSLDELKELNEYAELRGIQIIPEVDTPGHSTIMQNAYPELFGQKGILAFTKDALDACSEIYSEICELFPYSSYIHIGGDEGRMGWWIDWEECNSFGESIGINRSDEGEGMSNNEYLMLRYLAYFIKSNAEAVKKCGRNPIVWEGFHKITNEIIPKYVTVMSWETSYQLPVSLANDGFNIINCSWVPTYVVTPTWYYSKKECYNWDVYTFGTINPGSPYYNGLFKMEYSDKIIGGQLNSWGDTIESAFPTPQDGHDDEFEKLFNRIPLIAENVWNRDKRIAWEDISDK